MSDWRLVMKETHPNPVTPDFAETHGNRGMIPVPLLSRTAGPSCPAMAGVGTAGVGPRSGAVEQPKSSTVASAAVQVRMVGWRLIGCFPLARSRGGLLCLPTCT